MLWLPKASVGFYPKVFTANNFNRLQNICILCNCKVRAHNTNHCQGLSDKSSLKMNFGALWNWPRILCLSFLGENIIKFLDFIMFTNRWHCAHGVSKSRKRGGGTERNHWGQRKWGLCLCKTKNVCKLVFTLKSKCVGTVYSVRLSQVSLEWDSNPRPLQF